MMHGSIQHVVKISRHFDDVSTGPTKLVKFNLFIKQRCDAASVHFDRCHVFFCAPHRVGSLIVNGSTNLYLILKCSCRKLTLLCIDLAKQSIYSEKITD